MLRLTFYPNHHDVWVGELFDEENPLLATTHPATIAAAIFAMDKHVVRVETEKGDFDMQFPFSAEQFSAVEDLIQDPQMANWMSLFCMFSRFDFVHPLPYDTHAEIHFRAAVHHLPAELVKIRPEGPEPKGFRRQLKNRNRYIYYPSC